MDDLERRNDPYIALFHRIRVRCRRNKSSRSLCHLLMSFLFVLRRIWIVNSSDDVAGEKEIYFMDHAAYSMSYSIYHF